MLGFLENIHTAFDFITPAFVVLTLWRLNRLEKSIDKIQGLIYDALLDKKNDA